MIETTWYEGELNVSDSGLVDGGLTVSVATEEGDNFKVKTVALNIDSSEIAFTRNDVLNKLNCYLGAAAAFFGPESVAAETIEADIADVEAGGLLENYAFLFDVEIPGKE